MPDGVGYPVTLFSAIIDTGWFFITYTGLIALSALLVLYHLLLALNALQGLLND